MPAALPAWGGAHRDYEMDAPITVVGSTQAKTVGMSAQCFNVCMQFHQLTCPSCSFYVICLISR